MYKFISNDPHYQTWEIINTNTFEKITFDINPIKLKLLNHDTFDYEPFLIHHSPVRLNKYNAGILDLSKTYGRDVNNKFLYLCKPDDKRLPYFLVPYTVQASFDKMKKQLYITFEFKEWYNNHPIATISQNIGNVDIPENYYEYVLYSKSLNVSIQPFTKDVLRCFKEEQQKDIIKSICKKYDIEERNDRVFTIDSTESIDLDDGISIKNINGDDIVSIYITHVPIVLDYLNLWGSFTNRISTIYLPDKKRSMLPMALSQLCSLNQNEERICLVMDYNTTTKTNTLGIVKVKIHKNYSYDEEKLLSNADYIKIRDIFKSKNSHDLIEELMILFNKECTTRIKKFKNGIYKHITNSGVIPLPEPIYSYINISRSKKSCYTTYLEECDYAQFTSPIRRLVDILNIIQICFNENMIYFVNGDNFYEDWLEKIDYMNVSMRHIRKIQLKCKLLDTFINQEHKYFTGYVFDKLMRSDNKFKYNVFLPELKMNTSITIQEDLMEYSEHQFKVYVFQNEGELKKKIKLQILKMC
jgi:exoribonuclease R